MMRLRERELIEARLAKRVEKVGSLGGRPEAFSAETIPFRASLLSEGGELEVGRRGLKSGRRIRLLTAGDVNGRAGDGVFVGDDFYIILTVNRWTAHLELLCEARA